MKKVAETLKSIQGSEIYARIMDPSDRLTDLIEEVKDWWKMDLFGRNPCPALVDEQGALLKPTDLDLSCFLAALVDRGAVINLPRYENRRPRNLRDNEWIVSAGNRHGKLLGLTPNKNVFSFSVRMLDANVVKTGGKDGDQVGAYRNFMVVDLDGHFYDGWRTIEFAPSYKENAFLSEKGLWTGNKIVFDRFVHPNRWVSFFGQPYVLTKLLLARIEAEARDLFQQVKSMGGTEGEDESDESGSVTIGPSVSEKVRAFEAAIDAPIPESFPPFEGTKPETTPGEARERLRRLR